MNPTDPNATDPNAGQPTGAPVTDPNAGPTVPEAPVTETPAPEAPVTETPVSGEVNPGMGGDQGQNPTGGTPAV